MNKPSTPTKRIYEPGFVYVSAAQTDIRRTFERIRAQLKPPTSKQNNVRRVN